MLDNISTPCSHLFRFSCTFYFLPPFDVLYMSVVLIPPLLFLFNLPFLPAINIPKGEDSISYSHPSSFFNVRPLDYIFSRHYFFMVLYGQCIVEVKGYSIFIPLSGKIKSKGISWKRFPRLPWLYTPGPLGTFNIKSAV